MTKFVNVLFYFEPLPLHVLPFSDRKKKKKFCECIGVRLAWLVDKSLWSLSPRYERTKGIRSHHLEKNGTVSKIQSKCEVNHNTSLHYLFSSYPFLYSNRRKPKDSKNWDFCNDTGIFVISLDYFRPSPTLLRRRRRRVPLVATPRVPPHSTPQSYKRQGRRHLPFPLLLDGLLLTFSFETSNSTWPNEPNNVHSSPFRSLSLS